MIQSIEPIPPSDVPVGKIKSFGLLGPKYEIKKGTRACDGNWLVPIRVVETGEEMEYSYARMKADPDAP